MDYNIDKIRSEIRNKKNNLFKNKEIRIPSFVNKLLLTIVLTLVTLIVLKTNPNYKTIFYEKVYETNFSFATVSKYYQKYFGNALPFKDLLKTDKLVFNEKIEYDEYDSYLDGVKLKVDQNYLVPNQISGLVVFIGEKEGYGNTIIVQQTNGIDVWYGNMDNISVLLYDYVEEGSLIGSVKDTILYLVYKKDGEILNYEDYI